MTKRANFPGRKTLRRQGALARLLAGTNNPSKKAVRTPEQKKAEIARLQELIKSSQAS